MIEPLNILIVEDDPAMRVFIRASLVRSSLSFGKIFEARNGKEGIEILQNNDINFILSDINMPEMDGIEFMEWIYEHPVCKNIPVIAVTSEHNESLLNRLAYWGHEYIQKPFNLNLLEQQIYKFHGKSDEYCYLPG